MDYKENGKVVKVNKKFSDLFMGLKDPKSIFGDSKNKHFRNMHGKLVVDTFKNLDDYRAFIDDWRRFFV